MNSTETNNMSIAVNQDRNIIAANLNVSTVYSAKILHCALQKQNILRKRVNKAKINNNSLVCTFLALLICYHLPQSWLMVNSMMTWIQHKKKAPDVAQHKRF